MLAGNKPSESGCLTFEIKHQPVSFQSTSIRKNEFKSHVVTLIQDAKYFLSGDIRVSIEWYIHEQQRYETCLSADVDNIIKPLLDALGGVNGIIIDDCQVQSVLCSWIDWPYGELEKIVINIEYFPDEFVSKKGLVFVNIQDNLYMPIPNDLSHKNKRIMLDNIEQIFSSRNRCIEEGVDYYSAKSVMPAQRVFHKGRLNGFNLQTRKEILD